jgi:hypothetical protein
MVAGCVDDDIRFHILGATGGPVSVYASLLRIALDSESAAHAVTCLSETRVSEIQQHRCGQDICEFVLMVGTKIVPECGKF